MAALSARCVRSLARASIQISVSSLDKHTKTDECNVLTNKLLCIPQKTALTANGVSQCKCQHNFACEKCLLCSKLGLCNISYFSYLYFSARCISSAVGKSILRDCGL